MIGYCISRRPLARLISHSIRLTTVQTPWASRLRPPTARMTGRQIAYVVIQQGIIPMIVAGAVNFGIQTAVFNK